MQKKKKTKHYAEILKLVVTMKMVFLRGQGCEGDGNARC